MPEPGLESYALIDRDEYVGRVLPRLRLPTILEDLEAFTGLGRDEIRRRFEAWEEEKERDWAGRGIVDASAAAEFYRDTSCYLFAHATADRARYSRYRDLVDPYIEGERFLDFGAGIGCMGLFARRERGIEVTLADLDSPPFRFAEFRVRRHAPEIRCHRLDEGLPEGAYETVICLSTLEHIPQWRRTLRDLRNLASPGGVLVLKVDYEEERAVDHIAGAFGLTPEAFLDEAASLGLGLETERRFVDQARLYALRKP